MQASITDSIHERFIRSLFNSNLTLFVLLLGLSLISLNAYALGAKPISPEAARAHSEITEYTGPETCVACHEEEAQQMHLSVHYQQTGPTPNVPNILGTAGKSEGAFNTYCGSIRTSPFFTCAGCHVGNGLPPSPEMTSEQLNNIDCLMCHQDDYARIGAPPYQDYEVVGSDGNPATISIPIDETFRFMPDESNMGISILQAARTVHPTTRKTCLRCHAGASGSDGGKRGDMSSVTINPPKSSDIHMSPDGENIVCADCHAADNHRVMGRGLDLRPNDVAEALNCTKCHDSRPHEDRRDIASLDDHTLRVACQTCHIPTYAKDISTEMVRDWTVPHFSTKACGGRGGWLPDEVRQRNVIPSYRWFDGTSQVYVLDQIPTENANGEKEFGVPNGNVNSAGAKIYPMKEHRSVSAQHDASGRMIPHSTFTFFTTSSFDQAVREGMNQEGMDDSYSLVNVHTYQTINHGVEDEDNALRCSDCHAAYNRNRTPSRIDLKADLGYALKASTN
ncbi:MAG TPA: cytochrome c3 family protein, partial [Gammaproteobacteria bacterium]